MTIRTDPNKRLLLLLAIAGGALILLIYTLLSGSEEPEAPLAATAPPSSASSTPTNTPVPALMPGAPPPSSAPAPAARPPAHSPAPVASLQGLRLHGITSGAAIIGLPSGRQRLVRVGQPVVPGVTLRAIGQSHALLDLGGSEVRLTFQGPEGQASAPPAGGQPVPTRIEERRYLLGMEPRTSRRGAVTGYVVRRGADLPLLARAGLREGDVLISINGQAIDGQERLTQIPAELAGATTAEIEFERGGRRIRTTVPLAAR